MPAAVICTEPFRQSAAEMAAAQGVPDYPFALMAHPISAATREELRERARAVLPEVIGLLVAHTKE
ncbi:MAG TPA: hypothetical protein VIM86_07570 [Thermodesulfobacteriota bacterium]